MTEIEKQEWSKERIQAEMKDLEDAGRIKFSFSFPMILSAAFLLFQAVRGDFIRGGWRILFFVVGISIGIGGILLIKSALAKRRKYNALKKKL